MEFFPKAIETTGIIDRQRRLLLDESLPIADKSRVRVIVLEADEQSTRLYQEPLGPAERLTTAVLKYRRGEISQEKAAELAGLNRRDFILALAREKRDVFVVDFDDLKEELARG